MKLTDAFSLSRLVQQHRMQLARLALLLAVVLPISTAGASLLTSEWRVQRYLLLYHAPLFLAFLLWVRLRLLDLLAWTTPTLLLDSLVVLLAAARFLNGSLPLSGHMLFFVFSGLTTRSRSYQTLALVLAAETTYFKLVLWSDPTSWSLGILAGLLGGSFVPLL